MLHLVQLSRGVVGAKQWHSWILQKILKYSDGGKSTACLEVSLEEVWEPWVASRILRVLVGEGKLH